jgi:hypothetical protein
MGTQGSYPFRSVSRGTAVGAQGEGGLSPCRVQFASVVTALSEDAFDGSCLENGTTIIQCDLRTLDVQRALETPSTIWWRKEPYAVELHALATFHNPIT